MDIISCKNKKTIRCNYWKSTGWKTTH